MIMNKTTKNYCNINAGKSYFRPKTNTHKNDQCKNVST